MYDGEATSSFAYVGERASANVKSEGTVNMLAGSDWTINGELVVGHSGIGTVLLDSSTIKSRSGQVGTNAGSDGLVTLRNNSVWEITANRLLAGSFGKAAVRIQSGSELKSIGGEV